MKLGNLSRTPPSYPMEAPQVKDLMISILVAPHPDEEAFTTAKTIRDYLNVALIITAFADNTDVAFEVNADHRLSAITPHPTPTHPKTLPLLTGVNRPLRPQSLWGQRTSPWT